MNKYIKDYVYEIIEDIEELKHIDTNVSARIGIQIKLTDMIDCASMLYMVDKVDADDVCNFKWFAQDIIKEISSSLYHNYAMEFSISITNLYNIVRKYYPDVI